MRKILNFSLLMICSCFLVACGDREVLPEIFLSQAIAQSNEVVENSVYKATSYADSCEDKCYKEREVCIKRNGNSHSCDPTYDRCKARCK